MACEYIKMWTRGKVFLRPPGPRPNTLKTSIISLVVGSLPYVLIMLVNTESSMPLEKVIPEITAPW